MENLSFINPDLQKEINSILKSKIWGYSFEPSTSEQNKFDLDFVIGQDIATSFEYNSKEDGEHDIAIVLSLKKSLVDINE